MALLKKQAEQILFCTSDYALHDDKYGKRQMIGRRGTLINVEDLGHCLGVPNLEKAVTLILANYERIMERWDRETEDRSDVFKQVSKLIKNQKIPFNGTFVDGKYVSYVKGKNADFFEATPEAHFSWHDLFRKIKIFDNGNRRAEILLKELINMLAQDHLVKEMRLGEISEGVYTPFVVIDRDLVERRAQEVRLNRAERLSGMVRQTTSPR